MEKRKKFAEKVKQVCKQHEGAILKTVISVIVIAVFTAGYLVSWNFEEKLLSEEQFESCEKVAREVYEQKGQVIVEVPEEYMVTTTTTTIKVKLDDCTYRGKVTARLQNGELVMTRDFETGDAVVNGILMGIIFVAFGLLIVLIFCAIYEKIKR